VIAACYSMDLYCENYGDAATHGHLFEGHNAGTATFTGETWGECAKQARDIGWRICHDQQTCYCPKCSGKRQKTR